MLITPVMEYPLQISSSKILENKYIFFFCRHGCIGAKITAYIIVYFLKIQHQNDKSERENHLWGNVSLSCLQGKLPTIKALVMAWYGVERFHTIVFL